MSNRHMITPQETRVVHDLATVWNWFLALPDQHTDDDVRNFRDAIHDAQRIVLARPGRRQVEELNALLARTGKTTDDQPEKP